MVLLSIIDINNLSHTGRAAEVQHASAHMFLLDSRMNVAGWIRLAGEAGGVGLALRFYKVADCININKLIKLPRKPHYTFSNRPIQLYHLKYKQPVQSIK